MRVHTRFAPTSPLPAPTPAYLSHTEAKDLQTASDRHTSSLSFRACEVWYHEAAADVGLDPSLCLRCRPGSILGRQRRQGRWPGFFLRSCRRIMRCNRLWSRWPGCTASPCLRSSKKCCLRSSPSLTNGDRSSPFLTSGLCARVLWAQAKI